MSEPLSLGAHPLSIEDLLEVSQGRRLVLAADARARMETSRARVDAVLRTGEAAYGINTGFGHLASVRIPEDKLEALQTNLIRSHAAGVGPALDIPTTRGVLLLRAAVLAAGYSGVRPRCAELLIDCLNAGFHPVLPSLGSVGASGDLAPLAHLCLALLGEGEVHGPRGPIPSGPALQEAGLTPLVLQAKEGLALINGTQVMTAIGCLTLLAAESLADSADTIGAMTVEASMGSHRPFDPRLHALRPHPGQVTSAARVLSALEGSEIAPSHQHCEKVQDPYSLRCIPQVHGASRAALTHVRQVLEIEINSVTDNPTVLDDHDIISGGNFHGEPVALVMDHLTLAIHELASISERRLEQLVNPRLSKLPAFLAHDPGLESGMMIAQVTAAALVSESRGLCVPASADSIPTSANQEDHVSMGTIGARKAAKVLALAQQVLGIEAVAAAQALEHRKPLRPGRGVQAACAALREHISPLDCDRYMAPDLLKAAELVADGLLRDSIAVP